MHGEIPADLIEDVNAAAAVPSTTSVAQRVVDRVVDRIDTSGDPSDADLARHVADTNGWLSAGLPNPESLIAAIRGPGYQGPRGAPLGLLVSTTAFRCRVVILHALAQGRPRLHVKDDPTDEVESVDLWERLQRPMGSLAPGVDLKSWIGMVASNLLEQGDAHVRKSEEESIVRVGKRGNALPRAFIPLPCRSVTPVQTRSFYELDYWQFSDPISGNLIPYPPDQIAHVTYLDNPKDFFSGIGPMESCAIALESNGLAATAGNEVLRRGGMPLLLLLSQKIGIEQKELQAYLAEFRRQLLSAKNRVAGVGGLSGDFKLERLSQTATEMQLDMFRRYADEEVARAHGVPMPLLAQVQGSALSREIMSVAHFILFTDTAIPLAERICTALTASLVQPYEPDLVLDMAWDHVPALQANLGEKLDSVRKLFDMGASFDDAAKVASVTTESFTGSDVSWMNRGKVPVRTILGEATWQEQVARERGVPDDTKTPAIPPPIERLVDLTQAPNILAVVTSYRSGSTDRESAKGVLTGLFGLADDRAETILGSIPPPPEPQPVVQPGTQAPGQADPQAQSQDGAPVDPTADPTTPPGQAPPAQDTAPPRPPAPTKPSNGVEKRPATEKLTADQLTPQEAVAVLLRAGMLSKEEAEVVTTAAVYATTYVGWNAAAIDSRRRGRTITARSSAHEQAAATTWRKAIARQLRQVERALWRLLPPARPRVPVTINVGGTAGETPGGTPDTPQGISIYRTPDGAAYYLEPSISPSVLQGIAFAINLDGFASELTASIMHIWDAGRQDGVEEVAEDQVAFMPAGRREEVEHGVKGWALKAGEDLRLEVIGVLTEGVTAGMTTRDISRVLLKSLRASLDADAAGPVYQAGARDETRQLKNLPTVKLIGKRKVRVRDEAFKRYNEGRDQTVIDAAEAKGRVPVFRWNTQHDSRVRPDHDDIDGEERPNGESFSEDVTIRWPYDDEAPADWTCGCRCFRTRVGSIDAEDAAPD